MSQVPHSRRVFLAAAPPIAAAVLSIPSAPAPAAADALPPAFAAALFAYRAAHANAVNVGRSGKATDNELDAGTHAMARCGVALVTTPTTGAASARELLRVAIERMEADIPADDFDLDPSNPYGLEDRIDVALICAALHALEAGQ